MSLAVLPRRIMIAPGKESRITDTGFGLVTTSSSYASKAKEGTENNKENKPKVKVLNRSKCINFKFREPPKREELWEFFEKLNVPLDRIDGIAELPFGGVDVTFKTREIALKVNQSIWDKKKDGISLPVHKIYVPDKIAIQMNFVPIPFEDEDIVKYFQKFHGQVTDLITLKDEKGIKRPKRRFFIKKEDLVKNPIKSYVSIEGHRFFVSYFGQKPTCKYCEEEGHKKDNCKYLKITKLQTENTQTVEHEQLEDVGPSLQELSKMNFADWFIKDGVCNSEPTLSQLNCITDEIPRHIDLSKKKGKSYSEQDAFSAQETAKYHCNAEVESGKSEELNAETNYSEEVKRMVSQRTSETEHQVISTSTKKNAASQKTNENTSIERRKEPKSTLKKVKKKKVRFLLEDNT